MYPQENLLHHIFGVVGIAQNSVGDLEDQTGVLANDEFEGRQLVCAIKHRGLLRRIAKLVGFAAIVVATGAVHRSHQLGRMGERECSDFFWDVPPCASLVANR